MRHSNLSNPYIKTLSRILGSPKESSGDQVRFNSPFTPAGKRKDRNYHLYVNPKKGKFFDFRSSSGGSISYLFAVLGEPFNDDPDLPLSPLIELKKRAYFLTSDRQFEVPRADLPDEYRKIRRNGVVFKYLISRGLTEEDINYYQIGEGTDEYSSWAIIPSFDRYGRCEYWVARNTDSGSWRRYDNPQSSKKYHVTFLHQALSESKDKSVILCEGVFSSIVAGRTSCASLGKFVTNNQVSLIRNSGVRLLRICLDGDAWKESISLANRAIKSGMDVSIIPMPIDKDPADMGRKNYYDHISKSEFMVKETDLLKIRLEML